MGSSEALIRATVNRISARLGHGFADAAAELAVLAQDAPQRLRQEWDLFQDEVRAEAERIERGDQATVNPDGRRRRNRRTTLKRSSIVFGPRWLI
jgi:hypothetical protein